MLKRIVVSFLLFNLLPAISGSEAKPNPQPAIDSQLVAKFTPRRGIGHPTGCTGNCGAGGRATGGQDVGTPV